MKIYAVIGANYGDEGKGMATAFLTRKLYQELHEAPLIVLTNGGAQRGHTVESESGFRHVFHQYGSCLPDVPHTTWIPSGFCVNPTVFAQEREYLLEDQRDFCHEPLPKVFCHPDALVTTPYDMIVNHVREINRGVDRHGSTGMGVWITMIRSSLVPFRFEDLKKGDAKKWLDKCRYWAGWALSGEPVPKPYEDLLDSSELFERWLYDASFMSSFVGVKDDSILRKYDGIVFENAQGLLLSSDPTNEHTTPSITGIGSVDKIISSSGIHPESTEVVYVSRTYMTRHGAGPFRSECSKEQLGLATAEDLTNTTNPWQGSLRYGSLDPQDLNSRIHSDFSSSKLEASIGLFLTHADEISFDLSLFPDLKWVSRSRLVEQVQEIGSPLELNEIFQ